MAPELFLDLALRPALSLLPKRMQGARAEAMVLAICFQESRLKYRRQLGEGPARGYAQFERGTLQSRGGVTGVLLHDGSGPLLENICHLLDIDATPASVHTAIEYHDVLAVIVARLLLWTLPDELPDINEPEAAWRQYIAAWRPGKPHPETWLEHYNKAWLLVRGAYDH